MKDFKLIAIRPLEGCAKNFTKILKVGIPYVFFNEFDFSKYNDKERIVDRKPENEIDLYSLKNTLQKEIKINISAIVGENGSGKSSLVELFFVTCYNISVIKEILFDNEENRLLNTNDRVREIHVEIFYKLDNDIILLRLSDKEINIFKYNGASFIEDKVHIFGLDDFFYTLSINYSLHALNSSILGDWVNKIFHKNDGYLTPIVLNPYRIQGNIEINNEEYLIKSRLISNVLGKTNKTQKIENSFRNIIDRKIAHRLKVELNKDKFKYDKKNKPVFELTKKYGDKIFPLLFKHFLHDPNFYPKDTLLNRYAKEYILQKLISIASKYDPYKRLSRYFFESTGDADTYLLMLSKDNSHVTFKLIQAINFLSNELYFNRKESFNLTISYLSDQLEKESKLKGKELINILPPAFFKVDIEFKDADMFNQLSSGEKQRVFSISTLTYHLNNISSINEKIANHKYKRINVVFDELELYFHPELQRTLINDILENIKKIDLKDIYAINILLITHSPFILSDIPNSNILFLTNTGLPEPNRENVKTYGGNIHELLAQSFFLYNGLIGEYAKQRIQSIIEILTKVEELSTDKRTKDYILKEIKIIGEPFLREKLLEMYYRKYESKKRIAILKAELNRLENND